jgi:hypothetical protein
MEPRLSSRLDEAPPSLGYGGQSSRPYDAGTIHTIAKVTSRHFGHRPWLPRGRGVAEGIGIPLQGARKILPIRGAEKFGGRNNPRA